MIIKRGAATAYLNMIFEGICGVEPGGEELVFKAYLPEKISHAELLNLFYRGVRYDVELIRAETSRIITEESSDNYRKIKIYIGHYSPDGRD